MKSRIKKLLAAALALCLIAALVPGAALAAETTVATVPQGGNNPAAQHATLEAAIDDAADNQNAENRIVTMTASYTLANDALPANVTLNVPENITLTVSNGFTVQGTLNVNGNLIVNGTISNSGTINVTGSIAINGKADINGTLNLNRGGEVIVSSGTTGTNGGTLSVNGSMTGSGSIDVQDHATATFSTALTTSASIEIGANATVTMGSGSDTVTTTGSISIAESGKLSGNVTVNGSGTVTNAGEITGAVTVDDNARLVIDGDDATVGGTMTINGTLEFDGDYNFGGKTLSGDGRAVVSTGCEVTLPGNYDFSVKIDVADGATLNVSSDEMIGAASINGDAVISKDGSTTVITVGEATVSNDVTIGSGEKLVVSGELTLNADMTIETGGGLVVNGTVNINSNRSLTTNTAMSGSGTIYVAGELFNANASNAGSVKIQIVDDGLVYSQNTNLGGNIQNGETTGGGGGYSVMWQIAEGSSYNITVRPGSHGNVSNPPASGTSGTQVTITATPADGYVVDQSNTYYMIGSTRYDLITVSGDNCSFLMPQNDVTVFINFTEEEQESETVTQGNITVVTNHNGNGTVNASINGRTITITATASNNYYVKSIRFDSDTRTSTGNPATFKQSYTVSGTGNATVNVYVTFDSDEYTVTLSNPPYNDGTISLSSIGTTTTGSFAEKEDVTIYVNPDRDFYLRSLSFRVNGISTNIAYEEIREDVYSFIMPEGNVTVTAYFTDGVYEITKDIDGNGSLTITGEDGNVTDVAEEGEEIRITASANTGYRLGDIYVNYTDADDEDQVIYPEVEYKNNGNVDYYWFEMPEYDVEIYADFGEGDHVAWIDRSDMKNGTIRVSPNVADEDDTVSIYVTPDTGYQLDELIVEDEDGHDVTTTSLASGTRYTFRMPDSDVTVTATFKSRSYSSNFTDVPRYEWYYEAVSYVASEGLMNGVSTTQFNPNGTASRAQIVTILWRLAGEPSALTGAFTDVPAGQYYSTAVAWASRQGIVTGVGNNRFEPNSNITREQLAVILYRYAQDAGYTTSASANITGYYDYARVNSYARTAMSWAVGAGLITGTSTTTLSPQDTATRAQVATILMRFCENIAK